MKRRITIDARMVGMGGIGRYVESLVTAMLRERPDHAWTLVGDPARLAGFAGVQVRPCRVPIYSPGEWLGMSRYFEGADLVHVPHFNAPAACRSKLVMTVHDLIHFDYPEYQPFPGANLFLDLRLKNLLRRADGVITVSQATASALEARYPDAGLAAKTRVTWEAADAAFGPEARPDDEERLRRMGASAPFILYVGAVREHKNPHHLLEAFCALKQKSPGPVQLVLAGQVDARFDRKHHFLKKAAAQPDVRLVKAASDADLAALYRSAAALVLPSSVEGFGLPVVEAMQSGLPVILSDVPALREVGGDAALYFAPGQIDALTGHLYNVLHDWSSRLKLSQAGIARSRGFQWSRTAQQTLQIYDDILQRS